MFHILQIQCTKKLADELKIKTSKEQIVDNESLYSWHAHLFYYNRKKYCIVMNNSTRYNFIIGSLRKKDFSQFSSLVIEGIRENLLAEGFAENVVETYLKKCDDVNYAPTSERPIISQINEMIGATKQIQGDKEIDNIEDKLDEINRFNNKFVMLTLPETYSAESMKKALIKEVLL